jgi:hypothetical protein
MHGKGFAITGPSFSRCKERRIRGSGYITDRKRGLTPTPNTTSQLRRFSRFQDFKTPDGTPGAPHKPVLLVWAFS